MKLRTLAFSALSLLATVPAFAETTVANYNSRDKGLQAAFTLSQTECAPGQYDTVYLWADSWDFRIRTGGTSSNYAAASIVRVNDCDWTLSNSFFGATDSFESYQGSNTSTVAANLKSGQLNARTLVQDGFGCTFEVTLALSLNAVGKVGSAQTDNYVYSEPGYKVHIHTNGKIAASTATGTVTIGSGFGCALPSWLQASYTMTSSDYAAINQATNASTTITRQ